MERKKRPENKEYKVWLKLLDDHPELEYIHNTYIGISFCNLIEQDIDIKVMLTGLKKFEEFLILKYTNGKGLPKPSCKPRCVGQ